MYNKQTDKHMSFIVVKRSALNIQNQLIKGHNKDVIELDKSRGFSDNISFKHRQTLCQSWHSPITLILKN